MQDSCTKLEVLRPASFVVSFTLAPNRLLYTGPQPTPVATVTKIRLYGHKIDHNSGLFRR